MRFPAPVLRAPQNDAMTATPTLVFLHGVGKGFEDKGWVSPLSAKLEALGYPGLDAVDVVSPQYPNSLRPFPHDEEYRLPKVTVEALKGEEAARRRRTVELETARFEALLGPYREQAWPGRIAESALLAAGSAAVRQVDAYRRKKDVRARVLQRILAQVPDEGPIVLVGHSLGSVIALDVVRRLDPRVQVRALITIGSPLAHSMFDGVADRTELRTPPVNVDCWLNFWSAKDPVTFGSGVGRRFPWVLDQQVNLANHTAVRYFGKSAVATAVGVALFGSLSKEVQVASSLPEAPLSPIDTRQIMELAYAHCLRTQLKSDLADRFAGALTVVQAERAKVLHDVYAESSQRPHSSIVEIMEARFAVPPHRPPAPRHLDHEDAGQMLVGIAMTNPIAPYEIEVGEKERRDALAALAARMGLPGSLGHDAHDSVQFARRQLRATKPGLQSRSALRWAVAGMGAVALVASTGGLALAAAPGVAGAAAVTSALAAFGPGGMVGGLVTAGLLTTGGASAITGALARGSSVAVVEESVTYQLALSRLRHERAIEQTEEPWNFLASLEDQLQAELRRLAPFSDAKSDSVTALGKKVDVVSRAKEVLRSHGWVPGQEAEVGQEIFDLIAEVEEVLDEPTLT